MTQTACVVTQRSVSLRLARRPVQMGRWEAEQWHVLGLHTHAEADEDAPRLVRRQQAGEGEEYLWDGLRLRLYGDETGHYQHNLTSNHPVLFVVCTPCEETKGFRPYLLTLSQDEAASFMEVEEDQVISVPLPGEIRVWAEAFIQRVGVRPTGRRKRKLDS